ncbi:MAG: DNA helicase UvrD [Candidatus Nealsonbacteria bacterium]|nr:DNA helicase UvrD [Candidatus Nealsonbacteria bacterium]
MRFIADFHIHSKYSRATSKDMDIENLAKWAVIKGIKVLGTGDFTHPEWFKGLKEKFAPAEPGLFKLRPAGTKPLLTSEERVLNEKTRFLLTSEISCIYSKAGRVRKIHILIFAPDFETVENINAQLGRLGNLKSDGRPILGLDAKELVKIVLGISEDCLIVPGHLMTPWFSLFGSKSGFNSLEECFEEYSKYIYAGETGLSADPEMLWRMSDGRRITLISNSDAHSLAKLGREANVFDAELSYFAIVEAIKTKNPKKFLWTIEFFPEEGKYHYDGHRACGLRTSPEESRRYNNICPNCGKPLTIGVLNRVDELSDKEPGFKPEGTIPFKSLIPLKEIIAEILGQGVGTKQVEIEYQNLIKKIGSEFDALLNASLKDLKIVTRSEIAEGIIRVREGKVTVEPGYDGVFGKIRLFPQGEQKTLSKQSTLF